MSRQTRLILIMAVIALLAVSALVAIANHYRTMAPGKSVAELDAEPTSRGAATPATDGELEEKLEVFVIGRQTVRAHWENHPYAVASLLGEVHETEGRDKVFMHNDKMFALRIKRRDALAEHGMDEPEYIEIRAQYRAWAAGDEAVDPAWKATFDSRPDLVEAADLGDWDPLDL